MSTASPSPALLPRWSHRLLLALLCLVVATGCVRRRLTVRSNPPGALVYVDNQQIGTTPCSVDFTYYGTREIRLVKSGYETLTVNQPIPTPWYQIPPLDFVSDNLWPIPIRDNRTVAFDLQPQRLQTFEEVLARGSELRSRVQQAAATGPIGPGVASPGATATPIPATLPATSPFPAPSLPPVESAPPVGLPPASTPWPSTLTPTMPAPALGPTGVPANVNAPPVPFRY